MGGFQEPQNSEWQETEERGHSKTGAGTECFRILTLSSQPHSEPELSLVGNRSLKGSGEGVGSIEFCVLSRWHWGQERVKKIKGRALDRRLLRVSELEPVGGSTGRLSVEGASGNKRCSGLRPVYRVHP